MLVNGAGSRPSAARCVRRFWVVHNPLTEKDTIANLTKVLHTTQSLAITKNTDCRNLIFQETVCCNMQTEHRFCESRFAKMDDSLNQNSFHHTM